MSSMVVSRRWNVAGDAAVCARAPGALATPSATDRAATIARSRRHDSMCAGNDTGISDVMRDIVERGCADAPAGLSGRYLGLSERDRPLAFESPPGRVRTRHVIRHAACELRTVREHSCIHVRA